MTAPIYKPFILDDSTKIAAMLNDFAARFQTCIPAKVVEVISRDSVKVSPTVLQTDSEGNPVPWADVTTTVLTPFSGGLIISMPLAVGDTGWLVASDLDTSIFKREKKPSQQQAYTRHLYQYGFFVPDAINGYTISDADNGAIVISTIDGTTKISLKDKEITVQSDNLLKINAKSVNITSEGNNVVIDGVNFQNHTHGISGAANGTLVANLTSGVVSGITDVVTPVP